MIGVHVRHCSASPAEGLRVARQQRRLYGNGTSEIPILSRIYIISVLDSESSRLMIDIHQDFKNKNIFMIDIHQD